MTSSNATKKTNLYRGQPIPLGQLSADDFEDFTYCVMSEIGRKKGFKVLSGRQPSGDGGFDITAINVDDNHLICIQCKRYTHNLNIATVALELSKVALTQQLECSVVKEHYVISTGAVAKKLLALLRQKSRQGIIDNSIKQLAHKDLKKLIEKCEAEKIDTIKTVINYITNLKNLFIWSGTDFDNELGSIWSKIIDPVSRYFSLDVVLEKHPRPDFDLNGYFNKLILEAKKQPYIELSLLQSTLPHNLRIDATNDALAYPDRNTVSHEHFRANEIFITTPLNHCRVIIAPGGGGKSSTLLAGQQLIIQHQDVDADEPKIIPIYIKLSSYTDDLDTLIHRQLQINHGHWTSLPYQFFLLLDGVDEISGNAQSFLDELSRYNEQSKIKSIISLRETGLGIPAYLKSIESWFNRIANCEIIV
jgi:hypothetical protein